MFCVSRQNYLAYVRKATLGLNELGQGKLVGCRTNFNRLKIFLSPSFVEVLQLGIVAKEQRFPNCAPLWLIPEIAQNTEPAMKLVKMWSHICDHSTIPVKEVSKSIFAKILISYWNTHILMHLFDHCCSGSSAAKGSFVSFICFVSLGLCPMNAAPPRVGPKLKYCMTN